MSSTFKMSAGDRVMEYYIRYVNLSELIGSAYRDSQAVELNIILDMYSIYRDLLRHPDYFFIDDKLDLSSAVINLCAHYRSFFKNIGVKTYFHLVSSFNLSDINTTLVHYYNTSMHKIMTDTVNNNMLEMIQYNIDILKTIVPYLPDIFFHHTSFEAGVLMERIILESDFPTIILTKDTHLLQLLTLKPDTCILRPNKYKGQDCSYFINSDPLLFWNTYCRMRKIEPFPTLISPNYISIMNGLSGAPWRSLRGMKSCSSLMNQLVKLISSNEISPFQIDVSSTLEKLKLPRNIVEAENMIKCVDINFLYNVYKNSTEYHMFSMNNLYDPKSVQSINDEFFSHNLLDLDRL